MRVCWKFWFLWLFPHTQFFKYDLIVASMELCFQTDSSISLDDFSLGWRKPILSCLIARFLSLLHSACWLLRILKLEPYFSLVWSCLRLWRKALYPYYLMLTYNRSLPCPALVTHFHKCLCLFSCIKAPLALPVITKATPFWLMLTVLCGAINLVPACKRVK